MYKSVGYMMCEFNRMLSFAFFQLLITPLIDILSSGNIKISTKLPFVIIMHLKILQQIKHDLLSLDPCGF